MNKTMETLPEHKLFTGTVILSGAKNLRDMRRCFTAFSMTWFREKNKEEWRFINATARTYKIYKDLANCVLAFLEREFFDVSHIPLASAEEQAEIEMWLQNIPAEERKTELSRVVSLDI